jgi:hypothetical protein
LRDEGKKIAENRNFVNQMKGFEGWKQKYFFGSKLRTWTSKCMQCETEFKKLQ